MIVYVTTQGSRIVREGRHLLVKKENDTYHTLFIYKLEQLIIMGNVVITPQALKLLLRENIDTVFLRIDGRYVGRLAGGEQKNVFLRKRQFILTDDAEFCLNTARSIVAGKMANMATVLQRIQRTRDARQAGDAADAIKMMSRKLAEADSVDVVRGLEGSASARYFAGLRYGFDRDYGFTKRVRRPPTDPVNSVLSLLYTFIINRAYSAIRIAGLDPYPGTLHTLEYGRHSLPLDLVEEFRSVIADTLTLSMFNLGILKESDFYRVEPPPPVAPPDNNEELINEVCNDPLGMMTLIEEDDMFDLPPQPIEDDEEDNQAGSAGGKLAIRLYPPAFVRLVKAFEKKMTTEFYHPVAEKRMTYADAFVFQARQLRRVIEGEVVRYQPLQLK
ncbi:MAG: CRISPR-associated endonuclease Cas1 [Desulfuromonadaceae bacterium]|nr:CRISPR-associated endonuclease Cas1 [Desulfuromonadaceae bacterium]MDD2855887.1 CRISPR-associated endonuclease Cas1 [Desulfuromonadaceae bacterium]